MPAAQHKSVFSWRDYSRETSTSTVYHGPITAITIGGFLTQYGALKSAMDAISLGTLAKETIVMDETVLTADSPTNVFAQRELKWLVRYKGNTNEAVYTLTIPCADPTGRLLPGQDMADLTQTEMAAFVTAFETLAKAPDNDAESVSVISIELVGRNI